MRRLLPPAFTLTYCLLCASQLSASEQQDAPASFSQTEEPQPSTIHIKLDGSNDGWEDTEPTSQPDYNQAALTIDASYEELETTSGSDEYTDRDTETHSLDGGVAISDVVLPGEEVDFHLKLHSSTHHLIKGRANSDIGKILFTSRLMPSNEVKLSLKLKQRELEDSELVAYFDLANFTMELDGSDQVLNKEHKQLMDLASTHLRSKFQKQYQIDDIPEHAFMLVQMLSYWSVSPDGYIHEKRSIVSQ